MTIFRFMGVRLKMVYLAVLICIIDMSTLALLLATVVELGTYVLSVISKLESS